MASRKFSYLRKLDTEHVEAGQQTINDWKGFWYAMYPEVFQHFHRSQVASHKSSLLLEFEKVLRRLRLMSLKVDNFSNSMISKIRTSNEHSQKLREEAKVDTAPEFTHESLEEAIRSSLPVSELKKEEQKLIMEVAKDPKNPRLYKTLGDLYLKLEQFDDARESYLSVIKLDPTIKGVKRKLEALNKALQAVDTQGI